MRDEEASDSNLPSRRLYEVGCFQSNRQIKAFKKEMRAHSKAAAKGKVPQNPTGAVQTNTVLPFKEIPCRARQHPKQAMASQQTHIKAKSKSRAHKAAQQRGLKRHSQPEGNFKTVGTQDSFHDEIPESALGFDQQQVPPTECSSLVKPTFKTSNLGIKSASVTGLFFTSSGSAGALQRNQQFLRGPLSPPAGDRNKLARIQRQTQAATSARRGSEAQHTFSDNKNPCRGQGKGRDIPDEVLTQLVNEMDTPQFKKECPQMLLGPENDEHAKRKVVKAYKSSFLNAKKSSVNLLATVASPRVKTPNTLSPETTGKPSEGHRVLLRRELIGPHQNKSQVQDTFSYGQSERAKSASSPELVASDVVGGEGGSCTRLAKNNDLATLIEISRKAPEIKTENINVYKEASRTMRAKQWHQVKPTELKVDKVLRKNQTNKQALVLMQPAQKQTALNFFNSKKSTFTVTSQGSGDQDQVKAQKSKTSRFFLNKRRTRGAGEGGKRTHLSNNLKSSHESLRFLKSQQQLPTQRQLRDGATLGAPDDVYSPPSNPFYPADDSSQGGLGPSQGQFQSHLARERGEETGSLASSPDQEIICKLKACKLNTVIDEINKATVLQGNMQAALALRTERYTTGTCTKQRLDEGVKPDLNAAGSGYRCPTSATVLQERKLKKSSLVAQSAQHLLSPRPLIQKPQVLKDELTTARLLSPQQLKSVRKGNHVGGSGIAQMMSSTMTKFSRTRKAMPQQSIISQAGLPHVAQDAAEIALSPRHRQNHTEKQLLARLVSPRAQPKAEDTALEAMSSTEKLLLGRESLIQRKLSMLKEEDENKVVAKLQQDQLAQSSHRQLRHQFSTLQPVQGYTSTNDDLYKETIEKRKIREAIGRLQGRATAKAKPGAAPVSIVEKKKQQRLISKIEHDVLVHGGTGVDQIIPNERSASPRSKVQAQAQAAGKSTLNDSPGCFVSQKGSQISPGHRSSMSPNGELKSQFTAKKLHQHVNESPGGIQHDQEFFECTQLPVYEDSPEQVEISPERMAPSAVVQTFGSEDKKTHAKSLSALVSDTNPAIAAPSCSVTPSSKFNHRTLDVMMRKAAKLDDKSKALHRKAGQKEQSEDLANFARKFTNKVDFQKTFLRMSDAFSQPPLGTGGGKKPPHCTGSRDSKDQRQHENKQPQSQRQLLIKTYNSNDLSLSFGTSQCDDSFDGSCSRNGTHHSPARQQPQVQPTVEQQDLSFFMTLQRQYSLKQIALSGKGSEHCKKPLLLFANQPQVLHRPGSTAFMDHSPATTKEAKASSPPKADTSTAQRESTRKTKRQSQQTKAEALKKNVKSPSSALRAHTERTLAAVDEATDELHSASFLQSERRRAEGQKGQKEQVVYPAKLVQSRNFNDLNRLLLTPAAFKTTAVPTQSAKTAAGVSALTQRSGNQRKMFVQSKISPASGGYGGTSGFICRTTKQMLSGNN